MKAVLVFRRTMRRRWNGTNALPVSKFMKHSIAWAGSIATAGTSSETIKSPWSGLKAAYGGIVEAQYLLGWMFRNASGVEKDVQRAAKWMRLASEQGHPAAMRAYQYMKNYDGRA